MSQNELQRVVAELDELIASDEEQQDYCSETGPNEAMRRVVALTEIRNVVARSVAAASRIEAAQAVAPDTSDAAVAEQLVEDWDSQGRMPQMAWDFRGFAQDAIRRSRQAVAPGGGMCAKGQAFKDYVHQRLDAMGVPHSVPESEHDKAGCRVGGRLDFVEARIAPGGVLPQAVAISPSGLMTGSGFTAHGDYAIRKDSGAIRIVNSEFARGWNEARAAMLAAAPASEALCEDWVDEELRDIDTLLRRLGLNPEDCRTDGGRLRVGYVVEKLSPIGGSSRCPICGVDTPHQHTGDEIAIYRGAAAPASEAKGQCNLYRALPYGTNGWRYAVVRGSQTDFLTADFVDAGEASEYAAHRNALVDQRGDDSLLAASSAAGEHPHWGNLPDDFDDPANAEHEQAGEDEKS